MATDIKDYLPCKSVTLVHSRSRVMHKFHPKLHELIAERAEELGIHMVLNERVVVPVYGFPDDGTEFDVELSSGSSLRADLVVRVSFTSLILSSFTSVQRSTPRVMHPSRHH